MLRLNRVLYPILVSLSRLRSWDWKYKLNLKFPDTFRTITILNIKLTTCSSYILLKMWHNNLPEVEVHSLVTLTKCQNESLEIGNRRIRVGQKKNAYLISFMVGFH